MKLTRQERAVLTNLLRALGRRGGLVTASRLTPEQRQERSRKGGLATAANRMRREETASVGQD